jgi:hypothetical protein
MNQLEAEMDGDDNDDLGFALLNFVREEKRRNAKERDEENDRDMKKRWKFYFFIRVTPLILIQRLSSKHEFRDDLNDYRLHSTFETVLCMHHNLNQYMIFMCH